jgi:hypothetical protein
MKKINKSLASTIIGLFVAVASAWITIDWTNFDIKKEWMKLVLSAVIAAGGFLTQLKEKKAE